MWWRKRRRPVVERPLAEPLEPRILYAADLAAGLMLAGVADTPDAGATAEQRVLDTTGEYVSPAAAQIAATAASPPAVDAAAMAVQRGRLALGFETNVGQADAGIDFIARGSGVGIALSDGNATLTLHDGNHSDVVRMTLAGAAAEVSAQTEGEVTSHTNYLIGNPQEWLRNVANHAAVRYDGVYDGIDLRYYGKERALEYDFIVAAGADWRQIALRFDGADHVSIDADGALRLTLADTGGGARGIRFEAPVSYQDGANGREAIASRYVLAADGSVRFDIGAYDAGRALVIDPVLAYGSYFGNASAQDVRGVAVGSDGSVYLAGSDNSDAVVVKLSANLDTVVYTSYIGGLGVDSANGVAVDATGQAYVVGATGSPLFYGNVVLGTDAFVAKLSANGSSLMYTKTIAGGLNDTGNGIAVDAIGQAYMVGTLGTGASTDATVAKLNAAGSALLYQTTIAGNGADTGEAIAVDASGRAAITGQTASTNLGAYLVNAFDTSLAAGNDAFVFQLNAAGTAVTYGTLFGGNAGDAGHAIAYGPGGKIYITGDTDSSDLSTTSGAFQSSYNGSIEAFVAVFDPALSGAATRTYATYLSGDGNDYGRAIGVDAAGLVYVAGSTSSTGLVVTADAAQASNGGGTDGFLAILNPAGGGSSDLIYRSYLGGAGNDDAYALALGANKIVLAGATASASGIARTGGADTTFGGATDAFALSFNLASTLIVDTANDLADGNTTSIAALLAGKGADGKISLREAITAANNTANTVGGPDRILFSIGGGGLQTINLGSALPGIADAMVIDATSQGGFAGAPLIELNGSGAGGSAFGLTITAGNSTVRGLIINQFRNGGISLTAGGGNLIAGNYIGTDASGNLDAGNAKDGIYIESANNLIGGVTAADRNVISGNGWSGIQLWRASATGNLIQGNYIGLNAAGTAALGNDDNGIVSGSNASATVIGGSVAGAGNVIAGHNLTGTSDGIHISGGSGGTIAGNRIGTDAGGTLALPNSRNGILMSGTQNYTIGGAAAGAGNIIANSGASGVAIAGSGAGNRVQGNAIYANGGLGIDLDNDGVTANDGAITVSSPNLLTDAPVFTSATLSGGTLTLAGYVGSAAGQALFAGAQVEIFLAASDPSGYGEGQTTLGTLTADASGNFSGSLAVTGVSVGSTLTATATDGAGNTSEFGANRVVASANTAPVITSNGGGASAAISVAENSTAVTTVTATDADLPAQTLTYSISGGADAARFTINAGSGVLTFIAAPNYEAPGDVGANNVYDLSVQVSDGMLTDSQAVSVTVTNVNDAPSGANATVTTSEDTAYTFSAANFGFSDAGDSPANALGAVRVSTLPGAGTLTNNGAAVSAGQTITVADINLGRLVFTPAANANGNSYASFTFQVQDNGGTANGGIDLDASPNTLTINVAAVNDAPVLAGANNLNPINEDPSSNNGTLVSALLAGQVTDVDSGASTGIAVTAVVNTNGAWQYTTNGGGAWTGFGAPTATTARLLAADANTSVRFVPNADWNGSVTGGITFRAWDQTIGTAGTTANTATSGGTSAYSTATASASITVNPVNDAPGGTNNTFTTTEDTAYTFSAANFGFTDPNDTPANSLAAVRISSLPGAGNLTNNGVAVSAGQIIVVADINAGKLKFNPAVNANGTGYASFTFQVRDGGGTANGGVNLDPSPNTMTVNVTAVDDAPVNTAPAAQLTAYNAPLVFSTVNGNRISVADADAGGASIQLALNATNGIITLSGSAGLTFASGSDGSASMTFTGSLASINTALDGMTFTPTTNYIGAATISVQSDDLGNTGTGGPMSDSDSIAITVNAPATLTIVGDGFATPEDLSLSASSVLANDVDPALGTMSVAAVNGNAAAVGNTIALASGALLSMNADGTFTYNPNGMFDALAQGATAVESFSYAVTSTSGGTGSGTVVITINGANDAPILSGANNLNAIDEDPLGNDGTLVSALIAGNVTDADSAPATGIAVTAVDNANGTWEYSTNGGGAWTAFGAPTAGTARLLAADANTSVRFVPTPNWNGSVTGGITFRAWDQATGAVGGTADTSANGGASTFSTATASAGIAVDAVNDAPAGSDNSITVLEDTARTLTGADFGLTDASDSPANALLAVKIAALPGAGTLTNNGVAVSAGQTITVADIDLGRLVFTPVANANGSGYAGLTFQVQDDGGAANGGVDLDASPNTLTLNVTAVNDAPAGTNTTVTTSEDIAYTFVAANFGFSDATDSPANALSAVRISTLPGAGTLTNNGTAVSAGQTITVADINLGRLVFTPAANANGSGYAGLTFQVQDDGGAANGGIDLDPTPRTLTVDVAPVNDAPAGADRTVTLLEDSAHTFGIADFGFGDTADSPADALLAVRIATLPVAGTLRLNGVAVGAGQAISAADIAAGQLVFTPAANGNGASYASFTFQVQDDGGAANGGVDFDPTPNTLVFDVTAVNDAPSGADGSVTFAAGGAHVFGVADFVLTDASDAPADALAAVRIETLPTTGMLTVSGVAVIAGQSVAATDIALARLVFTPVGAAPAWFMFRVMDAGGASNGGVALDATARTMQIALAAPVVVPPAESVVAADGTLPTTPVAAAVPSSPPAAAVPATGPPPAPPVATKAAAPSAPAGDAATEAALPGATAPAALPDITPPATSPRGNAVIDAASTGIADLRAAGAISTERKTFAFESVALIDGIIASGSRTEGSKAMFDQFLTSLRAPGFVDQLDRLREDARQDFDLERSFAVTASGVTFGLSIAYVLWMVRSGVLMGSLLSSLPAWRVLDPLPVLAREGEDSEEDDDEFADAPPADTGDNLQALRGY